MAPTPASPHIHATPPPAPPPEDSVEAMLGFLDPTWKPGQDQLNPLEAAIRFQASKYYAATDPRWDDLCQAGRLGVMQGMRTYRPGEASLRTYLCSVIAHVVPECFHENLRIIHVHQGLAKAVQKAARELARALGHPPTEDQLVNRLAGLQSDNVPKDPRLLQKAIRAVHGGTASLDGLDGGVAWPCSEPSPETRSAKSEQYGQLCEAFGRLPGHVQEAIAHRFGFAGEEKTLAAIAGAMGVSKSTVDRWIKGGLGELNAFMAPGQAPLWQDLARQPKVPARTAPVQPRRPGSGWVGFLGADALRDAFRFNVPEPSPVRAPRGSDPDLELLRDWIGTHGPAAIAPLDRLLEALAVAGRPASKVAEPEGDGA